MALKLATLCLNLFFMVAVIGFIKISYVMVESCSLITLQIGILFLQIKVDDAREIELFRSQYEKSV